MWSRGRLGIWVVAASVVAAGCISSEDPGTSTSATPTTSDPNGGLTALERLRDLDAAGTSDIELALAELSAYLGPLPGAPVVGFDESVHPSMTVPLAKALALRDQMSDEQRAGFDAALTAYTDPAGVVAAYDSAGNEIVADPDVQGFSAGLSAAAEPGSGCPSGAPSADDEVSPLLRTWRQRFMDADNALEADFPGELDYVMLFAYPEFTDLRRRARATTFVGGREPESSWALDALKSCFGVHDCYILVNLRETTIASAELIAGHEWFHCWHYDQVETVERWSARPYWVSEGLAEWVGHRYAGTRLRPADSRWPSYFWYDIYDLFARSSEYSAMGLWAHVANHVDLVERIPFLLWELVSLNDQDMLLSVANLIGDEATAAIAAAPTQRPDLGAQWTTSGPGITNGSRAEPRLVLGVDSEVELFAEPGIQLANEISIDTNGGDPHVVQLAIENSGILVWSDGLASTALSGERQTQTRCVGTCVCPDGSTPFELPDLPAADAGFVVALSGVLPPGAELGALLAPFDEDLCPEESREPPPAGPRDPNRGGSYGHPNLVTFDGVSYVFHGAGDYALVESITDELAIHARYSRLNNMTGVSFNRAVAARVGSAVVTFGDDATSTAFDPAVVRVDGTIVQPSATPLDVAGEATLQLFDERFVLTWTDGTELRVGTRVGDQFDVLVPEARWGNVIGLLGDSDGTAYQDVVTRNGQPVDPHEFDDFYSRFGASWLLDSADSLFESALDPADIEPIVPSAQVTLADLSPALRAEAEATCRAGGVTPAFGLSQCIFDVAMTGDSSWIRSVLAMRDVIDSGVSVSALTVEPEDATTIEGDGTYTGSLGERFAVDVFAVDLAVGGSLRLSASACPEAPTFEVALVSPAGYIVDRSRGDDCGELIVRRVGEPGEYRIAVYDNGGFTGTYTVELGITEPGNGDEVAFGVPFDIVVGDPGVEPSVTFAANAGDRLTFTHPPDDAEVANLGYTFYRLIGPDGSVVESWPVREDQTVAILVDGSYTLLVDVVVGVSPGSVTLTISNDSDGAPPVVHIDEPFTMELTEPGGTSLVTFEAAAGDRLLVASDVPDVYFEAAATFRIVGPDGAELAWWFSFRDWEVDIPADGSYTLAFEPGGSDETSSFRVLITRQ